MSFFIDFGNVDKNSTYKIVSPKTFESVVNGEKLIQLSEESGFDIQILNENVSPIIVSLKDKQKFEYEQKKAKKDQEKKAKANAQKLKEIKFHVNISDNDINTKMTKIHEFLEKNCKVKLVMELRGRENSLEDLANKKFEDILNVLNEFNIEPVKKFGTSFYTFVTK